DPHFAKPQRLPRGVDPYASLKTELAKQAAAYPGRVLIVHGGAVGPPPHRPDHPIKQDGRTLSRVTRIKTYGDDRPAYWIKVSVTPDDKRVFQLETVNTVLTPPLPR